MMLTVLDLFAGLGGWSAAFRDRGHHVVTVDVDPAFGCTITADVLRLPTRTLRDYGPFDAVLASPPCEGFSVMNIGRNWYHDHTPKTDTARMGLRLVVRTRAIIDTLAPAWFIIENPRAKLRKMPVMYDLDRRTVTYCQYGAEYMKPTDLWGGFPPSLVLFPPCHNGAPCHVRAPRGSRTGIQGSMSPAERARVPYALSRQVCEAMEADRV
jgi:hypothetical protein